MIGVAVMAFGLLISVGAWNLVLWYQGGTRHGAFVEYVPPKYNSLLFPTHFMVFSVPDYLLRYLGLGVFTTTVGITLVASWIWKRLELDEVSQGGSSVGGLNDE